MTLLHKPICEGFAHSAYNQYYYTMTSQQNATSKVDQQSDSSDDAVAYVHPKKKISRQHSSGQQHTSDTFHGEGSCVDKTEEINAIQSMYCISKNKGEPSKLENAFPLKSFINAQPKTKSIENGHILASPEYPQGHPRGTSLPMFHNFKHQAEAVSFSKTDTNDRITHSVNTAKYFAKHSVQNWPFPDTSKSSSKPQMQKQLTSIPTYTQYSSKNNSFDLSSPKATTSYENSNNIHIPSQNHDLKHRNTLSPTHVQRQTSWDDIAQTMEPSFSKIRSAPADVWTVPSQTSKTNQPLYSHDNLPVDATIEGKIKEEIPFVNPKFQRKQSHIYPPEPERKQHEEQRQDTQARTSVFDMLKDDLNIELSHLNTVAGSSSHDLDPNECFKYLLSHLPARDQEKFLYLEKQYTKRQQIMSAAHNKDEQQKLKEEQKKIADAISLKKMREKMIEKPNLAALLMAAKVNQNPTNHQEDDFEQTINIDEIDDKDSDKSTVFRMMAAQHRYRTDVRLKQEDPEENTNEREPFLLENSASSQCDANPINYQVNNHQKEHSPYDVDSDFDEQSRHSNQVQATMKTPDVSLHTFQNNDNQTMMPGRYMGVPIESPSSTVDDKNKEMLSSGASSQGSSKKCQICNDTASGFHYGVWSCEGCKAFFKRSLQGTGPVGYVCPATNSCTIDKHRRKSCQACRLRKCLEMGMTKNTSRKDKGQQRAPRMTKRKSSDFEGFQSEADLLDVKRMKTENGAGPQFLHAGVIPPLKPDIKECPLVETLLKIDPPVQLSHHSPDDNTEVGINASLMKLADKELVDIINWAKAVPGYVGLSLNDRVHMIESSWMEQLILGLAWRSMPFRGEVLVFSTDMHMTLERIKVANLQPICGFLKCISVRFCDIKLTREEFVIVRGLCLVNAEVSKLESEEKIQVMKDKLIDALHFVIQKEHGSSIKRFGEVMLLLPQIRHCSMNSIAHMFEIKHDEKVPFGNLVQEMLQTRSNPNQAKADEERLSVNM